MSRHPSLTVVVLNAVTEGLLIQLTSDEAAYVAASREKRSTFEQKKKSYWSERSSPTKLWRSLTALLQRDERTANAIKPTCNDADDLLHFFEEKVKAVRASTEGYQPPTTTSSSLSSQSAPADGSLSVLSPCSEEEVRRLIMQSPTKSCALDPIPGVKLGRIPPDLRFGASYLRSTTSNLGSATAKWRSRALILGSAAIKLNVKSHRSSVSRFKEDHCESRPTNVG